MPVIAFNTANLVARFSGYQFELAKWWDQHLLTVEKTDEKEFEAICREIAQCGYSAVELWVAHIDPAHMTPQRAQTYKVILAEYALTPVALAGALNADTARVCQLLDIPMTAGGIASETLDAVRALSRQTGIRANHENHPENSVQDIREKIAFGADGLGIALDTGWLGTQGMDAPKTISELGTLIKHVHVKDVKAAGGHETVPLGDGCVDIAGVLRELKAIGYDGVLSWEDEPEDRNPFEIAIEMRLKINALWEQAN